MEERRPNPDQLLSRVMREEEQNLEGKLTIFFGAAPGVGKTYAMLETARKRLSEGRDVLAGIVETHGRRETEELLSGLENLLPKSIEYRGAMLREFDIDAALLRKPDIILVDELAHSNAPDSRHKKRWQDVNELLGSGISVYTTLNIQHLESLNDVVAQITGINVRETVPDFIVDRADEIELIDLSPDELLQRMKEGKVYVPDLADLARENFFRKGNLLALRELALRRTAERVDAQMRIYREDKGVKEVWPAAERILLCVGPNPGSIHLIRAAKLMAAGLKADWIVVYVEAPHKVKPSENDLRQLAEHMQLAESLGAETVTLTGQKASSEIISYARERNVTKILIGKPTHPQWKDKIFGSLLDEIVRTSGNIDVYVISGKKGEPVSIWSQVKTRKESYKRQFVTVTAVAAASTAIAYAMKPYLEIVDLAMIYLLGVVFTSTLTSRRISLFASILNVAAFDFFFVPPYLTFSVSNAGFLVTFLVMFVIAFIMSTLTQRIRHQADAARKRERRTTAMYSLTRKLVREREFEGIAAITINHIHELFYCLASVLKPDEKGVLKMAKVSQKTVVLDQKERSVAQWTFDHRQRAGLGTDTLSSSNALYLPLISTMRAVGVIGISPIETGSFFDQDQIHILESIASQTAMAIERSMLAEETQTALIKAETETLRNTLLSSVSHDLRTPLAAITGAATTLLQKDVVFNEGEQRELTLTIYEEAEHLNHLLCNILDVTRLQSGAIKVKKEWHPFDEIVEVVVNRILEKNKETQIKVDIPDETPLVAFDPLLIEQTLMNLLNNAAKYAPGGSPIAIIARESGRELLVSIEDNGPGVTCGNEEKIFDKFVRGSAAGGGMGLGLTICRAIIQSHGGRIWVENGPGGGAAFRFTLPLGEQPVIPESEN